MVERLLSKNKVLSLALMSKKGKEEEEEGEKKKRWRRSIQKWLTV